MIENKKSSILLILKVLEEYTDETHSLTYNEIIEKIYLLYGIKLERKSIASSINLLIELDYDIEKHSNGGVSLYSRALEKSEVTFLIDAIFSSKAISGNRARELATKVSKILSKYDRKSYNYLYKTSEVNRTKNSDVFLNIELIQEAINNNKKISFQYITYNDKGQIIPRMNGFEYRVSPYYLVNNYGRYYLLCNYRTKYQNIQIFRVDYMMNIRISDDSLLELEKIDKKYEKFSITKYLNEHVYLFGGDTITAKLLIKDSAAIGYIYDWFGSEVNIIKEDEKIFTKVISNETALIYWLLQYGEHVKVVSPLSLKEKVKEKILKILED